MDLFKSGLAFFLFSIVCNNYGLCYPYGPPTSACDDGLPVHVDGDGVAYPPQTSPCPFQIEVNATSYTPGDVIFVTVKSDQKEMFKGLFLQMHTIPNDLEDGESGESRPLSTFKRKIENTKLRGCKYGWDTASHKDPYLKTSTELIWRSPIYVYNDVVVRATILTNYSTYWTNCESQIIKLELSDTLPVETLVRPWLEEIIKTIKAKDKRTSRDLVKSRFLRGFNGVIDPNGYIMVQYVMDILPFQDSYYVVNSSKNVGFNSTGIVTQTQITNASTLHIVNTTKNTSIFKTDVREISGKNSSQSELIKSESQKTTPKILSSTDIREISGKNSSQSESIESESQKTPPKILSSTTDVNKPALDISSRTSRKAYEQLLKSVLAENIDAVIQLETYLKS